MSRYEQLREVSRALEHAPPPPPTFRVSFTRTEQLAVDIEAPDRRTALTPAQQQWRTGGGEYEIADSRESRWMAIVAQQADGGRR